MATFVSPECMYAALCLCNNQLGTGSILDLSCEAGRLQALYLSGNSEQYLILGHKFSMLLLTVFAHPSNQPPCALNRGSHDANASRCSGDDRRRYFTTRLARAEARRNTTFRPPSTLLPNEACSGRGRRRKTLSCFAPGNIAPSTQRSTARSRRRHHSPEERSGRSRRRDTSSSGWLGPHAPDAGFAPAMRPVDATPQRSLLGPKPSTQAFVMFRSGHHCAIDATSKIAAPASHNVAASA